MCVLYEKVYAVDDRHLFIRNFRFEKTGPDAYFWVGQVRNTNQKDFLLFKDIP